MAKHPWDPRAWEGEIYEIAPEFWVECDKEVTNQHGVEVSCEFEGYVEARLYRNSIEWDCPECGWEHTEQEAEDGD